MRRLFRSNGLALVTLGLFLLFLILQSLASHRDYNQDQKEHREQEVGYVEYLGTGHFKEGVFENWESEFLQMGAYVLLTVFLRQRGSPESKKLEGEEDVDADPDSTGPRAPWPVRRGGLVLKLYENSLAIALFALFFLSMLAHAVGGAEEYSEEQVAHGEARVSTVEYMSTSRFWSESMQNWQSEFLAVGSLVVLSVFLRQKGSPESKPVDSPHHPEGGS